MKLKKVINYDNSTYNHPIYIGDEGERYLCKCENCGGYVLVQYSEYHGFDDDSYYIDYIEVDGQEAAEEVNQKYSGFSLETESGIRYLAKTGNTLVWR